MSGKEPVKEELSDRICKEIVRGLGAQMDKSDFFDVTVVAGEAEFKCHRVLLSACSGFFSALLTSGMKEDVERRINLKAVSKDTFESIREIIYNGKNILTVDNMFEIWHGANQLQILLLLRECEAFLKKNISAETCVAIYQHAKLLDSKEMIEFAWNFLLREFDSVRRYDDVLSLSAGEMKKLVACDDLCTKHEDEVVDTLLRWAAHTLTDGPVESSLSESFDDSSEVKQCNLEADNQIKTDSANHETKQAEQDKKENDEQSMPGTDTSELSNTEIQHEIKEAYEDPENTSATDDLKSENKKDRQGMSARVNELPDLLKAARICLASGRCLVQTLEKNEIVLANPRARDVVQTAIRYQLQDDRRHDFCPPSAVSRGCSKTESVIFGRMYNRNDALVCRNKNGEWHGLGNPIKTAYNIISAVYDNDIYVLIPGDESFYEFKTSTKQWRNIGIKDGYPHSPSTLMAAGDFLYTVSNDKSVHSLNIREVAANEITSWAKVGDLALKELEISCSTLVCNFIVYVGSNPGHDGAHVVGFNTSTLTSVCLKEIPGPSSGMVAFKKETHAFLLQKNGQLWRMTPSKEYPFVDIKYETLLWDFERNLRGAIIYDDELLLFGDSLQNAGESAAEWELSVAGVFKRVKNITCPSVYPFAYAVIPKVHMTKKI